MSDEQPKTAKEFFYRLFFTRNDDLDLLQVILYVWITVVGIIIFKVGHAADWRELPPAAWDMLKWMTGTLVVFGVPKWMLESYLNFRRSGGG